MKKDFASKGRSVSDLKLYLFLTTKYRRKALERIIFNRLHEVLEDLLEKWGMRKSDKIGQQSNGGYLLR